MHARAPRRPRRQGDERGDPTEHAQAARASRRHQGGERPASLLVRDPLPGARGRARQRAQRQLLRGEEERLRVRALARRPLGRLLLSHAVRAAGARPPRQRHPSAFARAQGRRRLLARLRPPRPEQVGDGRATASRPAPLRPGDRGPLGRRQAHRLVAARPRRSLLVLSQAHTAPPQRLH